MIEKSAVSQEQSPADAGREFLDTYLTEYRDVGICRETYLGRSLVQHVLQLLECEHNPDDAQEICDILQNSRNAFEGGEIQLTRFVKISPRKEKIVPNFPPICSSIGAVLQRNQARIGDSITA